MRRFEIKDPFGRSINYLRISVTDRCNYRCIYCMPEEGIRRIPHDAILTYEEILAFVRTAVQVGINRIRLTGGEPLARQGLPWLVKALVGIPEIEEVSLTTNGSLLSQYASPLAEAGLKRVNVSLDTISADKFMKITRGGSLDQVWSGIAAAEAAGLTPLKINVVVIRGINDNELLDLARLTFSHPWQVRFIELMPIEDPQEWGGVFANDRERYVPVTEIREALTSLNLQLVADDLRNGPAKVFKAYGALGTVGFISPIGEHFCGTCNRLRLTADGRLRPCLFNDREVSIIESLRAGEDILPYLKKAIALKPLGHALSSNQVHINRKMSQIGG